jgi:hypothetical protein
MSIVIGPVLASTPSAEAVAYANRVPSAHDAVGDSWGRQRRRAASPDGETVQPVAQRQAVGQDPEVTTPFAGFPDYKLIHITSDNAHLYHDDKGITAPNLVFLTTKFFRSYPHLTDSPPYWLDPPVRDGQKVFEGDCKPYLGWDNATQNVQTYFQQLFKGGGRERQHLLIVQHEPTSLDAFCFYTVTKPVISSKPVDFRIDMVGAAPMRPNSAALPKNVGKALVETVIATARAFRAAHPDDKGVTVTLTSAEWKIAANHEACASGPDFSLTAYYKGMGFITSNEKDMSMTIA